jgi:hypothetical protein
LVRAAHALATTQDASIAARLTHSMPMFMQNGRLPSTVAEERRGGECDDGETGRDGQLRPRTDVRVAASAGAMTSESHVYASRHWCASAPSAPRWWSQRRARGTHPSRHWSRRPMRSRPEWSRARRQECLARHGRIRCPPVGGGSGIRRASRRRLPRRSGHPRKGRMERAHRRGDVGRVTQDRFRGSSTGHARG